MVILFLGLEIGSWAEWFGSAGTILTVWLSISFYGKDNRVRFLIRQTRNILKESKDGSIKSSEGVTLYGFNDSSRTALLTFCGFYLQPCRMLRIRLWWINKLVASQGMNRWVYKLIERRAEIRPIGDINIKNLFFGNEFETVKGFGRTTDQKIPLEYLLDNAVNMLRQDKYNSKRLKKGKEIIVVYVFQKHDGTEYHSRMVLDTEMTKKIKEKLKA